MSFKFYGLQKARSSALAALLIVAAQSATASTVTTREIVDVIGPTLIDTTTRQYEEDGKTYEEILKKFETETVTRTTQTTSRTVYHDNAVTYDYNVYAGFGDTGEKWYNPSVSGESGLSSGTRTLSWGKGSDGPSSYTWTPDNRDNVAAGSSVRLGRFTHDNNTIYGGITDTTLDMRLALDLDGGTRTFDFAFDMDHVETWNWGKNVSDTVLISDERFTRSFTVGATDYTLKLLGFHAPWFGGYDQSLDVSEGATGSLDLLAIVTSRTAKTVTDTRSWLTSSFEHTYETMVMELPAEVPLPAAAPLLIGAVGALGLMRRRRRG